MAQLKNILMYFLDILAINSSEDSFCVGDYLGFQSYTREGRSFSLKFCNNTEPPLLEMEGTVQVVFQSDGSLQDTGMLLSVWFSQ